MKKNISKPNFKKKSTNVSKNKTENFGIVKEFKPINDRCIEFEDLDFIDDEKEIEVHSRELIKEYEQRMEIMKKESFLILS